MQDPVVLNFPLHTATQLLPVILFDYWKFSLNIIIHLLATSRAV